MLQLPHFQLKIHCSFKILFSIIVSFLVPVSHDTCCCPLGQAETDPDLSGSYLVLTCCPSSGGVSGQRDVPLQRHRQGQVQREEVRFRESPQGGPTLPQSGTATQGNTHRTDRPTYLPIDLAWFNQLKSTHVMCCFYFSSSWSGLNMIM